MNRILYLLLVGAALSVGYPTDDCANKPADVVFVLDTSNSIWLNDFAKQTSFVRDVVEKFDIGPRARQTRVGILTFGHAVWKQFNLNERLNKEDLLTSIVSIKHGRGRTTNTAAALNYALDHMFTPEAGARQGVTQVVIVITDGRSQKTFETKRAAARLHASKVTTFAIGVGRRLDLNELQDIASNPDSEYLFMVDDFAALSTITIRLAAKACEVSTPAPITTTTEATTRSPPSDQSLRDCGGKPADIFFAIDSSGSISSKDFNKEISFVQSVIRLFDLGYQKTRVGVVSFSHEASMVLPLTNHLGKGHLLTVIAGIRHVGGGTNTAEALKMIRQTGFAPEFTRPGVPKIVIVLTDGLSADDALTAREARFTHASDIKVFSIGIGKGIDLIEIRNIASDPDDDFVFQVDDFSSLDSIKELLAIKTCGVKPSPVTKPRDQPACDVRKTTDMMFIYDTNAMGLEASKAISTFLSRVVSGLDLRSGKLHVGRVTDLCPTGGNMQLSNRLSSMDFSEIRNPTYADLLRKVRRNGFTAEYGGRDDASNVAVVFFDSEMSGVDQITIDEANLIKQNSELVVVTIGNGEVTTKVADKFFNRYYFHANSYADLETSADDFVSTLCDFFTFDSLDYNIEYVVPV